MALGAGAWAAPEAKLQATTLNGSKVELSGENRGRRLLMFGFRHQDQGVLEDWRNGLGLMGPDPRWLEIPVIPVDFPLAQDFIRKSMRDRFKGRALEAHLAPLFADPAMVSKRYGLSPSQPALVVLDQHGHVLARASGRYEPGKAELLLAALNNAGGARAPRS